MKDAEEIPRIMKEAFYSSFNLKSVSIPDSVTTVESYAFANSFNLKSVVIGKGVTSIAPYAFSSCDNLKTVYYKGTQSEWNTISIGSNNTPFNQATLHYYSETEPTEAGNYWHYVNGKPTAWA